ncbi:hypothetical protein [Chondromyces apiculatus]|uniref:hypothetical protein n=1 Tax=Chondromyces apiculatus TaxID=51 RepID=UPI0012DFBBE5|nr:hypothetical protein [Chondromyces apiculatus]
MKTLRVSPAMRAGITDHVWTVEELLAALLTEPAAETPTAKPVTLKTGRPVQLSLFPDGPDPTRPR